VSTSSPSASRTSRACCFAFSEVLGSVNRGGSAGNGDLERVPRTGDGRSVTSDLVTSQLVMEGFTRGRGRGRGVLRFTQLPETFRRVFFSFGGRVRVGYGGFQPANHMALIFICGNFKIRHHSSSFLSPVEKKKIAERKRTGVRHFLY